MPVALPSRVALVGAGFLGCALSRALGPGTIVTSRSGRWRTQDPPEGVALHRLDLTEETLDTAPLRRCRALHIAVAPGGSNVDRRALYVEGTRRLLAQTADHPWVRIVYISSTSALPSVDGWVFEDESRRPDTARGSVQREAEDIVLAHGRAKRVPTLVLRLGGLYGPGRGLGRVYRRRSGQALSGSGNTPTNLIHLDDAVSASLAALAAPAELDGIVHVVDDDHCTRRAMYAAVAASRGMDPVTWEHPPRTVAPWGKRVSNLRLKLDLGVRLKHPMHR